HARPPTKRWPRATISTMRRRPALLALGVSFVFAACGVAFAAAPSLSTPAHSVAAQARDDGASLSSQIAPTAPAAEPVAVAIPAPEPKAAPAAAVFDEMKHVWQSLNNCGPASVVMALSTFGIDVSQEFARVTLRGTNILSGMGTTKVDGRVNAT